MMAAIAALVALTTTAGCDRIFGYCGNKSEGPRDAARDRGKGSSAEGGALLDAPSPRAKRLVCRALEALPYKTSSLFEPWISPDGTRLYAEGSRQRWYVNTRDPNGSGFTSWSRSWSFPPPSLSAYRDISVAPGSPNYSEVFASKRTRTGQNYEREIYRCNFDAQPPSCNKLSFQPRRVAGNDLDGPHAVTVGGRHLLAFNFRPGGAPQVAGNIRLGELKGDLVTVNLRLTGSLNNAGHQDDPALGPEGLLIVYASREAASEKLSLWAATRASVDRPFLSPAKLAITDVDAMHESGPELHRRPGGEIELYYNVRQFLDSNGSSTIYRARCQLQ